MIDPVPTSESAALAVRLLDGSPDGLILVDADGVVRVANRSTSDIFGYDANELVGMSVEQLVPREVRGVHVAHRRAYSDEPERRPMGTDLRLLAEHRNGETFPVEVSLSPIALDGEVQTVATIRDVTERQEAMARLELHRDRERIANDLHDLVIQRLFAAGMSLQSVTNLIESPVARERVISVTDELDQTVSAVRSAIFRLGHNDTHKSLTSHVSEVVHERSRSLGFTPHLSISGLIDDLPEAVADQLLAALTEALSNIARHAGATKATIKVTNSADAVNLSVRDNGKGVSPMLKPLGGLSNMMWRAAEMGGSCSVAPAEPSGTELIWQVPV